MLNTISALIVTGTLSATGLTYMVDLESTAEEVTQVYVSSADERFRDYEDMLPGVVEWPKKSN